jgi:hypothetical protein
MITNATLVGPRTPTPLTVYEPRIWAVRIWIKGGPFAGVGFLFKAPYGVAVNAGMILTRAACRFQITRYQLQPATSAQINRWGRKNLERYEDAFEKVGVTHAIDWAA